MTEDLHAPNYGSFRDPENAAVSVNNKWYRVASDESADALRTLRESSTYDELVEAGAILAFNEVPEAERDDVLSRYESVGVRRLPPSASIFWVDSAPLITYPWEWTDHQLRAAGLLTLRIRGALLNIGLDLKDASAFNMQFRGLCPVLMDIGSVERWRPNPSWNAARQYIEHFLNPLALGAGGALSAADAWAMSGSRGLPTEIARPLMRFRQRRRFSLWALQASARSAGRRPMESAFGSDARAHSDLALRATTSLTGKLARATSALGSSPHETTWQSYGDRSHYQSEELERKLGMTAEFIAEDPERSRCVLDIGGNDGLVGEHLAAHLGANVVVLDRDAGALDNLCARLVDRSDVRSRIWCVKADFTSLPPASGLLEREFASFTSRVRPSAVLCQAVLHHIVISQGVPIALAVEALARFGGAPVLIEFALEDDPKVQLVLSQVPNWLGDYSEDALLCALSMHYRSVRVRGETSAHRILVVAMDPR